MSWDLFSYQEELEKAKNKPVTYTNEEYRNYIIDNFKPAYNNSVFYNIVMTSYFSQNWYESTVTPQEQLEYFKQLYDSFCYHLQTEEITIFSMKHKYNNAPDEYSVFVAVKNDFILELTRVKDLFKESLCAPACAINWFNADGTQADISKVLTMTQEEKEIWLDFVKNGNEIINPKETKEFSFSEWWKDRREFYCFYKLKLHKYGKPCRVFEKHKYDNFADYTFTLLDMFNYFSSNAPAEEKEEIDQ